MVCLQRVLCTFYLIIILIVCLFGEEALALKKWRAHIKTKRTAPKISATFKTVPSKHKTIGKHIHSGSHEHSRDWLLAAAPFWNGLQLHDTTAAAPAPTYYLAANYPRWRTNMLKRIDLAPSFMPLLPYAQRHGSPLRRADRLALEAPSMSTEPFIDMRGFNSVTTDDIFNAELSKPLVGGAMAMPPSFTPLDYKSFMTDADFSLLHDRFNLNRRVDLNALAYINPFGMHLA